MPSKVKIPLLTLLLFAAKTFGIRESLKAEAMGLLNFSKSAKLIIGSGKPTKQFEDAAKVQGMAIINPETLEKLVKLQSQHRNSVDLFKLTGYLKSGLANDELEKYITQVETEIGLRSQIVQAVKQLSEPGNNHLTNAMFAAAQSSRLDDHSVHDLLVEVSSPLTGYLGRIRGSNWHPRSHLLPA